MKITNAQLDVLSIALNKLNDSTWLSALSALAVAKLKKKVQEAAAPYTETKNKILVKYGKYIDKKTKSWNFSEAPEKQKEMEDELRPLLEEVADIDVPDKFEIVLHKDDGSLSPSDLSKFVDVFWDSFVIKEK